MKCFYHFFLSYKGLYGLRTTDFFHSSLCLLSQLLNCIANYWCSCLFCCCCFVNVTICINFAYYSSIFSFDLNCWWWCSCCSRCSCCVPSNFSFFFFCFDFQFHLFVKELLKIFRFLLFFVLELILSWNC